MIEKWAKLLPYGLLMWFVRKHTNIDGLGTLDTGGKLSVAYYQIDAGEFVVFSKELQDRFDERRRERRQTKLDKKLDKLNDKLRNDCSLKSALRKQFEDEFLNEKIEW